MKLLDPTMQSLNELDLALTQIFENFKLLAHALQFETICELSDEATVELQKYPGLYKIDIHNPGHYSTFSEWFEWFKSEWVQDAYEKKHTPNPKKKRVAMHSRLDEWVPLYIGKSRHISGRVWEHINLKLNQPTTAMKINERKNMAQQRFRLNTLRVDVKNYDLIVPKLESALRDLHNPLLGRQ